MAMYEVVAVKDRYIKSAYGTVKAEQGYVVYRGFQYASSGKEAVSRISGR